MCGGGGGGQRGLEEEEKALLRMQTRVAEQGIAGRDQAMAGYRDFLRRGREMGSAANQDREAGRVMEDAYAAYGTANRMQDARLASMGVNPADARFSRGRDTGGVGMAAQAASGANQARRGARAESLQLEGAGLAGLGGFDPTGALSSMGSTIGNAQRTNAMADASTAQGWGQLAQAGMYGLSNADKIEKGFNTVKGWMAADGGMVPSYAEGGEVMGLPGYANGGNVYDTAFNQVGQARSQVARGPAPQQQSAMDPMTATKLAKAAVDKASSSSLGYSSAVPGLSSSAPGSQAAMLAEQTGAFGAEGLASTAAAGEAAAAGAAGAEAAGAGLASGAAGVSSALGAAVPILGLGMLAAGLFGRKDGGPIPRAASRPGIGRKQVAGKAQNSKGGKVSGPGGPKDDMVMARLSPGEYVLPVGAVKKYGLDRLEKMRQEGLAFERQRNIT